MRTNGNTALAEETTQSEAYMSEAMNLGDIPDLSGVEEVAAAAWETGWYEGTILEQHSFTDRNGNDRVFESGDTPSANGNSRNIRLQVGIKRQLDGRTMNVSTLINYQPEDLTQATVAAVTAHRDRVKEGDQWGSLFRPFMTLSRLGKLQKIADVRQLQRNGDGGLQLKPLYGRKAYFKLGPDEKNPQYMTVKDFRETKPKACL